MEAAHYAQGHGCLGLIKGKRRCQGGRQGSQRAAARRSVSPTRTRTDFADAATAARAAAALQGAISTQLAGQLFARLASMRLGKAGLERDPPSAMPQGWGGQRRASGGTPTDGRLAQRSDQLAADRRARSSSCGRRPHVDRPALHKSRCQAVCFCSALLAPALRACPPAGLTLTTGPDQRGSSANGRRRRHGARKRPR